MEAKFVGAAEAMSKSARVPEPSMEEILASIRRIIADDSSGPAQDAAAGSAAPAQKTASEQPKTPPKTQAKTDVDTESGAEEPSPPPEADILELTQPVEQDRTPAFTAVRGADVVFREEDRQPPAEPTPVSQSSTSDVQSPAPAPARDEELLSPASTAAVSAAFNSLATTVLSGNARTLEDLVKELMRPMLKAWLDENLPGLVERIVRAEIERVARGGR